MHMREPQNRLGRDQERNENCDLQGWEGGTHLHLRTHARSYETHTYTHSACVSGFPLPHDSAASQQRLFLCSTT